MQPRHNNRKQYFDELALTSEKYYVPYMQQFITLDANTKILEIGCGEGGNLLPFARLGCDVVGVDMSRMKIEAGKKLFEEEGVKARFIAADIFKVKELEGHFDLILVHDVIEHIFEKEVFMQGVYRYLAKDGIAFFGFPAWYMPFGGHQQVCHSKWLSHTPFIHLLPRKMYSKVLEMAGEQPDTIREMLEIKSTGVTVELFDRLCIEYGFKVVDRILYFINPHYEVKFKLKPRKLNKVLGKIPYLRNFITTSCFYVIKKA